MGCDIHVVLQKQDLETEEWTTIDHNVLTGRNYQLFTFLSGVRGFETEHDNIAHHGLPSDFAVKTNEEGMIYHGKTWMGDHSHGWVTLEEFCEARLPELSLQDRYEVEKTYDGYHVTFRDPYECDDYHIVRALQTAWNNMYGTYLSPWTDNQGEVHHFNSTRNYRLAFGYDS